MIQSALHRNVFFILPGELVDGVTFVRGGWRARNPANGQYIPTADSKGQAWTEEQAIAAARTVEPLRAALPRPVTYLLHPAVVAGTNEIKPWAYDIFSTDGHTLTRRGTNVELDPKKAPDGARMMLDLLSIPGEWVDHLLTIAMMLNDR